MTDVALALPLPMEEVLASTAARYGHRVVVACSGAEELAGRLASVRAEVAVVSADDQYLSARLVAACDSAGVRLVVVASTPAEHRHASQLGILDPATPPLTWELLSGPVGSVGRQLETAPVDTTSSLPRRRGTVIAVWGPAGAPGRTTVAVAVASELATTGASVALADADTHAAAVAPVLGLLDEAPGFAAACRLAGSGDAALHPGEFERIAQDHPSRTGRFWILTGLGRPGRWPELREERVAATLAAARDWVDYTVVDVAASLERDDELSSDLAAPRRNAATIATLRSADHVVVVGAGDPVGISRLLRGHAELIELIDEAAVTVVINKVRASAIGLNPAAQLAQTLHRFGGVDDPVLIPHDPEAVDGAVLSGTTLAESAPRSAVRSALRDLVVERILPPVVSGVTSERAGGRLFRSRREDGGRADTGRGPRGRKLA